jgi:hypothetical protein
VARIPERTWRLVPSQFPPIQAFDAVSSSADLEAVMELEGWTNDRLVEERLRRLPSELWVYGRPNSSVVMAAFLHPSPDGSRFSGPDLGMWYCSLDLRTAIAEVAHHLRRAAWHAGKRAYTGDYRTFGADLLGDHDDLRGRGDDLPHLYRRRDYAASQAHGERRRAEGADGILYDSLRLSGGVNAVAFKPPNVAEVAGADHWRIRSGTDAPPVAQRLPG